MKASKTQQSGYVMLEIMLGIVVMGMVMAMALNMTQEGEDQSTGRTKAESISSFSQLASQYFLANRGAITVAMTDGTEKEKYCVINIAADGSGGNIAQSTTKHTCAFDATLLKAKGVWPAGMSTEAMGGRYVAITRQIYDETVMPPVATGGVDLLIVLASPSGVLTPVVTDNRRTTELISAMTTLGGTGGAVPVGALGSCKTDRALSIYEVCGNGWKVNLSDFIDPDQVTVFGAALPH